MWMHAHASSSLKNRRSKDVSSLSLSSSRPAQRDIFSRRPCEKKIEVAVGLEEQSCTYCVR
jgi:hypothetical protein